jgi:hypothetical protein
MGAWGYGLLQNDATQDALLRIVRGLSEDVGRLRRRRPAPDVAGRVAAAVGVMLQLQLWHCFDPEREAAVTLLAVLERQAPAFSVLPKTAIDLLGAIRAGKGAELANQNGDLPDELAQAFFDSNPGFPMERGTGVRHAGMFEHPAGAAYVQEVADRYVELVSRGFADLGQPPEMWDEHGEEIAALSILLQLRPCRVAPELFRDWWDRYCAAEGNELEYLDEYETAYRRCLWRALNYGWMRFSGEPRPAPLTLVEPATEEDEDE